MAGAVEVQQREMLARVLDLLKRVDPASPPPEIGDQVHRIVRREVGDGDPYQALKQASTRQALHLYPRMRALLAQEQDSLEVAVRLSIAGNIIDAGRTGNTTCGLQ